ncbi:hypothetical protein BU24DRAFT_421898 [Aaosphaeria arxii CBS 175.79]|uniref:Uncharacterized protein n=1 Tax=Aaosphaeria arxii CBS 175.79 TaxID=1450172 RepID=A0A6A5XTN1_9PLEO|nr:uncharacterized protein BU24DRAFT_421898 [Aaosphaeria arxii CBS 175.79]KAF2015604.1 hypothetical protein BU24DRAFT_421898 [Aaosphaeria arxii CBS 175.79]
MSSSQIPILFTLPPSNRHELILLDTSTKPTLKSLNKQITTTISTSPNCAEFMSKYKAKPEDGEAAGGAGGKETIQEFRVHWSEAGRDRKVWPEYTTLTEGNLAAVLEVLKLGVGKDVLEIKLGKGE